MKLPPPPKKKKKKNSSCHYTALCFDIVCFQRRWQEEYASITVAGCIQACLFQSPPAFSTSVLFLINILLWWVTLPFIYRQLLPDNVFFPLPLKGERPILSRMLMPCKSRSEAELRGSKLPSLLFGWALLKNSIRVLNHRQKKHCLQRRWAFFSFFFLRTQSRFLSAERETFARFVLGRRSRRHKKGSIPSRLRGEFRINVCSGAAATMEKVHTSIKMSACAFLWIQQSSHILGRGGINHCRDCSNKEHSFSNFCNVLAKIMCRQAVVECNLSTFTMRVLTLV